MRTGTSEPKTGHHDLSRRPSIRRMFITVSGRSRRGDPHAYPPIGAVWKENAGELLGAHNRVVCEKRAEVSAPPRKPPPAVGNTLSSPS
jgi:hypothetical protein